MLDCLNDWTWNSFCRVGSNIDLNIATTQPSNLNSVYKRFSEPESIFVIRYLYKFPPWKHDLNCGIYHVQALSAQRSAAISGSHFQIRRLFILILFTTQVWSRFRVKTRPPFKLEVWITTLYWIRSCEMNMPPRARWRKNGVEDKIIIRQNMVLQVDGKKRTL